MMESRSHLRASEADDRACAVRVVHVVGAEVQPYVPFAVAPLLGRLPAAGVDVTAVSIDGATAAALRDSDGGVTTPIHTAAVRLGLSATAGWRLRRLAGDLCVDVVHAWGADALAAAGAVVRAGGGRRVGLVVTLCEPSAAGRLGRWAGAFGKETCAGVICPTGIARRRAVEAGLPDSACVQIQPGVDLSAVGPGRGGLSRRSGWPSSPSEADPQRRGPILVVPPILRPALAVLRRARQGARARGITSSSFPVRATTREPGRGATLGAYP